MSSQRTTLFSFLAMLFAGAALIISLLPYLPIGVGVAANIEESSVNGLNENSGTAAVGSIGRTFNYQGTLYNQDGTPVESGTYQMTFKIYKSVMEENPLYTEVKNEVNVRDGMFTVVLGDDQAIGSNVFAETPRYLGITVDPDPEMLPRQRIHPVPWALQASQAAQADTLKGGAVIPGGISIRNASKHAIGISNAGEDGVYVSNPGDEGLEISGSGGNGVKIIDTYYDGVSVSDPGRIGFAVWDARQNGLYIEDAGEEGVEIRDAGKHGVYIYNPGEDGVYVSSPDDDGIHIEYAADNGVVVKNSSNDGIVVEYSGRWAGNFHGHVYVEGNCTGCRTAVFGRNASNTLLEPGDIVTVQAVSLQDFQEQPVLDVMHADSTDVVIGVVSARAELDEDVHDEEVRKELVPRSGAAEPGEYVSIITSGLAQVKTSATDSIEVGALLTPGAQAGYARSLEDGFAEVHHGASGSSSTGTLLASAAQVGYTTSVSPDRDSVRVTPGSIVGVALESSEKREGLVWVLVNPR